MSYPTDEQVKAEIENGEPRIDAGDTWSIYEEGNPGKLVRQLLVIGIHPVDDDIVICEDIGDTKFAHNSEFGSLLRMPEYNLRRIFRPDYLRE